MQRTHDAAMESERTSPAFVPPQALVDAHAVHGARRLQISVRGAVQGVGFRPYVYRLARSLGLAGWVANTAHGVEIEVEGSEAALLDFARQLRDQPPPLALIQDVRQAWLPAQGASAFVIHATTHAPSPRALLLPDLALCPDCLADIQRPGDRRYRYAFTNCTHCGPRFTIVEALPYDRPNTTMRGFALCPACRAEYDDPDDRRFHAQPVACPTCGPRLSLLAREQSGVWVAVATEDGALRDAAMALRDGKIVAVKGLGGFHLMVDAGNEDAVRLLRTRKAREEKPLAIMVAEVADAELLVYLSEEERALLTSNATPIVLAERRAEAPVGASVAPGATTLGLMLAYTPLHRLLLEAVGRPVVATSGNLSDEPICIDNDDALARLGEIADLFLMHDRPIARHVDDSLVRVIDGAPTFLRRARGYAPMPVRLAEDLPPILAVGGHLKNTVALTLDRDLFLSQHIGDLETVGALTAFARVIDDFLNLYDCAPVTIVHDLHPDYASTQWARRTAKEGHARIAAGTPLIAVQHHHAHLAACLADAGIDGPALGVTWDGSGYGPDGTVWGGEFLVGDASGITRFAHLRPFRLPGGERAVREPRRSALAMLWEVLEPERATEAVAALYEVGELRVLTRLLARGFDAPVTTSAGRLFDGLAALAGLTPRASYEGQAAMFFEYIVDRHETGAYPVVLQDRGGVVIVDWQPLIEALLADMRRGVDRPVVAARAHRTLAQAIVEVAERAGQPRVALSGGCFQNRILTEWSADALRSAGFEVIMHRRVPPNDGGLCLGQVVVAAASRTVAMAASSSV